MENSRKHLEYFLDTYLSISDGSLAEVVCEFAQGEPERVASFIQELGYILDGDVDPLRALIRVRGNYYLPDGVSPRDLLVPLRDELQRQHLGRPHAGNPQPQLRSTKRYRYSSGRSSPRK